MKFDETEDNLLPNENGDENIENIAENLDIENKTDASDEQCEESIEVENLQLENAKLKEDFLRACADLENSKKRYHQELEKTSKYAIASFAKDLLTVADNLHRALTVSEGSGSEQCENLRKGVELTESELMKVFGKFGIKKMDILGKVFDPFFHQVIQEVEDKTKPAGTIVEELQTGYMINDRILREAMVIVTK